MIDLKRKIQKMLRKVNVINCLCLFSMLALSQEYKIPESYMVKDIFASEIDLDGDTDLVIGTENDGTIPDSIFIFYNNGIGKLSKGSIQRTNRIFVTCGKVDEDQLDDIITMGGIGIIFIKNFGDGTFGEEISVNPPENYKMVDYIVDMDGDGMNDLVYSYSNMYTKWGILKNEGELNFTDFIIYDDGLGGKLYPRISHFNNDNLPDISIAYMPNSTHVLLNNGDFSFDSLNICSTRCHEAYPFKMNQSELDDIILFSTNTDELFLIENQGNEQFIDRDTLPLIGPVMVTDIADFNNDGFDDYCYALCYWTGCTDSLYISMNDQHWNFLPPEQYYIGTMEIFRTETADLNGDNFKDIVLFGYHPRNAFKILWNDGFGGFSYENPVSVSEMIINPGRLLSVYPNPSESHFTLDYTLSRGGMIDISIITSSGYEIGRFSLDRKTAGNNREILEIPPGYNGLLFLVIWLDGAVVATQKVIRL